MVVAFFVCGIAENPQKNNTQKERKDAHRAIIRAKQNTKTRN